MRVRKESGGVSFAEQNAARHPKCQHVLAAGKRRGQSCGRKSLPHDSNHCARHDPTGRLTLARAVIEAIRDGRCPRISGPGDPPVIVGHVRYVGAYIAIRVTKVNTDRDGWWLRYVVVDNRPDFRNLRRTPADEIDYEAVREAYAPENFRWDQLPVVKDKHRGDPAERSAYTGSAINLVAEAGEAPAASFMDDVLSGKYKQRKRDREAALRKAQDAARELREAIDEPGTTGRERKHLKEIEHHLEQLKRLSQAA